MGGFSPFLGHSFNTIRTISAEQFSPRAHLYPVSSLSECFHSLPEARSHSGKLDRASERTTTLALRVNGGSNQEPNLVVGHRPQAAFQTIHVVQDFEQIGGFLGEQVNQVQTLERGRLIGEDVDDAASADGILSDGVAVVVHGNQVKGWVALLMRSSLFIRSAISSAFY